MLVAAILAPIIFMIGQAASLLHDIPESDEFGTVLEFFRNYERADSWRTVVDALFAPANEHRMLTSRLLTIGLYELTGEVNFVLLAVIGDLFLVATLIVLARQQNEPGPALQLGAIATLLLVHLQHHENLFSSYASIDHFLVVLLATGSLALLTRHTRAATLGATLLSVLAVFTLAQGVAILPAGILLLVIQRRWREALAWSAVGCIVVAVFVQGLPGTDRSAVATLFTAEGWANFAGFWLTLVGGTLALGHDLVAASLGALALVLTAWLIRRGTLRAEPFLGALLLNALGAMMLIAFGRAQSDIPPLGSRYMVQSALLWAIITFMILKHVVPRRWQARGGLAVVALLGTLNVAANIVHAPEARYFVQRRIDSARHYDMHGTLVGTRRPIFPNLAYADRMLAGAETEGIFRLRLRYNSEAELDFKATEAAMHYYLDFLRIGRRNVHIRGWVVPPRDAAIDGHPHLVLTNGTERRAFRGFREKRPDVAAALQRPDAVRAGFYFIVPRRSLAAASWRVSLLVEQGDQSLFTNTDHRVDLSPANPDVMPLADD